MSTPADPDPPVWRPTVALVTALGVGLALLVLAAAARRPALAVLAVPLLADAAWAVRRVGRSAVAVRVDVGVDRVREGDDVMVAVTLDVPADADLVQTTIETEPLVRIGVAVATVCLLPPQGPVVVPGRAGHWGRAPGAQVHAATWAAHGLLRADPVVAVGAPLTVEPVTPAPARVGDVHRVTGIVGPRPSARPGDGSAFVAVRPFVTGDRLRRVNWRVTARRGDLHVTTTTADREAVLVLAVDSTSELGPYGDTSLDVAVRTAAGLARRHLFAGDRVGLVDLAVPSAVLRPDAGRRHLDRVVDRLVTIRRRSPGDLRPLPAVLGRSAPGAVVVVLTPLLRDAVGATAGRLAQLGRAVVVVDTLGDVVDRASLSLAERLLRLEQQATAGRLADAGVPVVAAADAPAAVARVLARRAAPGAGRPR